MTVDIEGVLIHGAQGVRSLSVLPIARALRALSLRPAAGDGGDMTAAPTSPVAGMTA